MWKPTKLEQQAPDHGGGGRPPTPPTDGGAGATRVDPGAIITAAAFAAGELALRAAAGRAAVLDGTRAGQATREAGRLAAKHGARAPAAVAALRRATARRVEATVAKVAAARAKVPVVAATPDAATFHGRVVDREHRGRAGVDVEVRVDERTVVKATTDKDGYYRVDVPAAAAAGRTPLVGGGRPIAARLLATRGGRPLARDAAGVTVAGGKVAYRELVIDDDGPVR